MSNVVPTPQTYTFDEVILYSAISSQQPTNHQLILPGTARRPSLQFQMSRTKSKCIMQRGPGHGRNNLLAFNID